MDKLHNMSNILYICMVCIVPIMYNASRIVNSSSDICDRYENLQLMSSVMRPILDSSYGA